MPDAREELVRREGLDDVVVRTHEKPRHAVVRLGARARDEDNRHLASIRTKRPANLVPRQAAEWDLEQNDARPDLPDRLEGLLPGRHLHDLVASRLEDTGKVVTRGWILVCDQYRTLRGDRRQT